MSSRRTSGSSQLQAHAEAVVPQCMNWSVEEVADWMESLGFPQYRVRQSLLSMAILRAATKVCSISKLCSCYIAGMYAVQAAAIINPHTCM